MNKTVFALTLALLSSPSFACKGVQALDGWIRQAPPGASVMAGYVRLKNISSKTRHITAITSPQFGAVEVHQTLIEDGESRMQALDTVELAPHSEVTLSPGDMHLMLFRPQPPQLQVGEQAIINLHCGKARPLKVTFTVKALE